jgi:hypothetical protein
MSSVNTLHKIMTFIDEHSDSISEGDYLDMCNKLSDVYKNEQTNTYNRNRVLPRSLQNDPYDTIYERCMVLVRKRKEIKKLFIQTKLRRRITSRFKIEALTAYCSALNLPLCVTIEELQSIGHASNSKEFFTDYMRIINEHTRGLQNGYIVELDNIELEMENICNFMNANNRIIDAFYDINVNIPNLS